MDPYDEAFYKPTKIIGRVMSGEEAERQHISFAELPLRDIFSGLRNRHRGKRPLLFGDEPGLYRIPQLMATFSTSVRIISVSASTCSASSSAAKSLSMTAATPSRVPYHIRINKSAEAVRLMNWFGTADMI